MAFWFVLARRFLLVYLAILVDERREHLLFVEFCALFRLMGLREVYAGEVRWAGKASRLVDDRADLLPQHLHVLPGELLFLLLVLLLVLVLDEALLLLN